MLVRRSVASGRTPQCSASGPPPTLRGPPPRGPRKPRHPPRARRCSLSRKRPERFPRTRACCGRRRRPCHSSAAPRPWRWCRPRRPLRCRTGAQTTPPPRRPRSRAMLSELAVSPRPRWRRWPHPASGPGCRRRPPPAAAAPRRSSTSGSGRPRTPRRGASRTPPSPPSPCPGGATRRRRRRCRGRCPAPAPWRRTWWPRPPRPGGPRTSGSCTACP
mmetsp:Transcript_54363/g.153116  ORF Transcript_54363/g.153116 Transcript_54363/m.153116 type:complete len:217 (-) Transcript_54363:16-666(-)